MILLVPPIKCQGIKSKLVPWIKTVAPPLINSRWVEPCLGSGVVAFNVQPEKALLCDINPHLINFYKAIQTGEIDPDIVEAFLLKEGQLLSQKGEDYYYEVRGRFNSGGDPLDFLFLNRSCFNGMIRFNKSGGMNVPFCRKPSRFSRSYITKITNQVRSVHALIQKSDYEFKCQDFEKTLNECLPGDVIYCDPPYIDRHVDYYNGWSEKDEAALFKLLSEYQGRFILSTWHSNDYRENTFIALYWSRFHVFTREHFYHVGGFEQNRNSVTEALILNFEPELDRTEIPLAQSALK